MAIADHDRRTGHVADLQRVAVFFEGHQQLEQLRAPLLLRGDVAFERAQRVALMTKILLERSDDGLNQVREGQVPAKVHAQWADLGEQSQGCLELCVGAVAYRQADHPLIALPSAADTDVQCPQQHRQRRHAQGVGQRPQLAHQARRNRQIKRMAR